MVKAMFFIEDGVQEVGYRLYILQKLLNSDLNGTAINLPDGRVKVLLEGKKERILQFIEELKKEKPELAENPRMGKPTFDESLAVPDAVKSSQALQLEQFGKSVVFLKGIENKLDSGFGGIENKLDNGFGRLENKLDSLPERITGRLEKKLDSLPERITGRLEKKLDSLPERITGRLEIKLDSLPERIAKAIKNN